MFVSERRCKGRDKKSTPGRECQNSANSAKTLPKLYLSSARNAKILRLINSFVLYKNHLQKGRI